MTSDFPGFPAIDLKKLDAFLLSDKIGNDGMMLSDMDGFLTAIAVGPEMIMPKEWLPKILGSKPPKFSSVKEAEEIMGMIMARYNEILRQVAEGPESFEPIFWENKQGQLVADDWAQGFLDAFAMRRSAWDPLLNSDEHHHLFIPIGIHMFDDQGKPLVDIENDEANRTIFNNAPHLIPECVVAIDRFWKQARQYYQGREKTGRNDPCPCGSGKKFKKCCGNN